MRVHLLSIIVLRLVHVLHIHCYITFHCVIFFWLITNTEVVSVYSYYNAATDIPAPVFWNVRTSTSVQCIPRSETNES